MDSGPHENREEEKITFDYLLQKVIENVNSTQRTTQADEESDPVYKVKFDTEGEKFAVTTDIENQQKNEEACAGDKRFDRFLGGDDVEDFIFQTESNFGRT